MKTQKDFIIRTVFLLNHVNNTPIPKVHVTVNVASYILKNNL